MTGKKKRTIILAIAAVLLALVVWTVWGNTALELNTYTVGSKELPDAFDGYRSHGHLWCNNNNWRCIGDEESPHCEGNSVTVKENVETKESRVADRNRNALPLCNWIENPQNDPYLETRKTIGRNRPCKA